MNAHPQIANDELAMNYLLEQQITATKLVHWPTGLKVAPGSLHHAPAHVIDLLPTALAVSGGEYGGAWPLSGTNLIIQINEGEREKVVGRGRGERDRSGRQRNDGVLLVGEHAGGNAKGVAERTEQHTLGLGAPVRESQQQHRGDTDGPEQGALAGHVGSANQEQPRCGVPHSTQPHVVGDPGVGGQQRVSQRLRLEARRSRDQLGILVVGVLVGKGGQRAQRLQTYPE